MKGLGLLGISAATPDATSTALSILPFPGIL